MCPSGGCNRSVGPWSAVEPVFGPQGGFYGRQQSIGLPSSFVGDLSGRGGGGGALIGGLGPPPALAARACDALIPEQYAIVARATIPDGCRLTGGVVGPGLMGLGSVTPTAEGGHHPPFAPPLPTDSASNGSVGGRCSVPRRSGRHRSGLGSGNGGRAGTRSRSSGNGRRPNAPTAEQADEERRRALADLRRPLYEQLVIWCGRFMRWVELTRPILGFDIDPGEPPDDEEALPWEGAVGGGRLPGDGGLLRPVESGHSAVRGSGALPGGHRGPPVQRQPRARSLGASGGDACIAARGAAFVVLGDQAARDVQGPA